MTASTGIAAVHIGGTTLHSFAGIGFGEKPLGITVKRMSNKAKKRWLSAKLIIIDEVCKLIVFIAVAVCAAESSCSRYR